MVEQTDIEALRAWSWRRQGLDGDGNSAANVLRDAIAVYSSHPTAPLSILARRQQLTADEFSRLETDRQAIRLPAMRGSIFLMPGATAPMILSATRMPLKKLQGRLEYGGLTWNDYERIKQQFQNLATTPKTTDELQELIPVDGKLMVAIRVLAYEGLALRVGESLRSDSFRYVSTVAWLGEPLSEPDADESLAWLASEYLRSFGPAAAGDFAWWAGVTKTRARKAFAACETVDVGGGLLLRSNDLNKWEQCQPLSGDETALLPKWDAYTMGYPAESRARFVDEVDLPKAYPKVSATRGDGAPLLLRGGKAIASWGHRFSGGRLVVTVSPFQPNARMSWLQEEIFAGVANLLGATGIDLSISSD